MSPSIPDTGRPGWRLMRLALTDPAGGVRVVVEVHGKLVHAVASVQDVEYLDCMLVTPTEEVIDLSGLRHAVMNGLQSLYLDCPHSTADMVRHRVLLYVQAIERKYGYKP